MTGTRLRRAFGRIVRGVMAMGLLASVTLPLTLGAAGRDHDGQGRGGDREDTLLVWASDAAHVAPDFLAIIDFDRESRHYGRILDLSLIHI